MPTPLTNAYAIKISNISKMFQEIQKAAVPPRFSQDFINGLGFTSSNDRLLIGVLKGLGFVDSNGIPTDIYRDFRDPASSKIVLAKQIRKAYAGLFELNTMAQSLTTAEVKGKFAALTNQSETVLKNMAATFTALCAEADFSEQGKANTQSVETEESGMPMEGVDSPAMQHTAKKRSAIPLSLSHTININLPTTRDVSVYDAIFKALKEHLL